LLYRALIDRFGLDQSYMLINLPVRDDVSCYLHAYMCILAINHKLIEINYTDNVLQNR